MPAKMSSKPLLEVKVNISKQELDQILSKQELSCTLEDDSCLLRLLIQADESKESSACLNNCEVEEKKD